MQFTFNYSTLRGFFDSFSAPLREREVKLTNGSIKVQQRGEGDDTRFYMPIRIGFSNYQYQRIRQTEMLQLAEALIEIAQDPNSDGKDPNT